MRATAVLSGLATLGVVWLLPLDDVLPGPFAAHMTMHMGVVAVAAPLLALGVAGSRFDPVRRWPRLFPAIPLSVAELIAVWAFHAPALHHFARTTRTGLAIEQGTFLGCGLLLWLASCGGRAGGGRTAAGVVALLLTSMHMTLLGALLALSPRPLYGAGDVTCFGIVLEAGQDQQLGGVVMLAVGAIVYLAGGLSLVSGLLGGAGQESSPR